MSAGNEREFIDHLQAKEVGMKRVFVDGSTTQTCTVIDGVAKVRPIKLTAKVTNNQGEYYAVLAGLERAYVLGLKEVEILSDSQLVVKQWKGEYQIKNPELRTLWLKLLPMALMFNKFKLTWVCREENLAGIILG